MRGEGIGVRRVPRTCPISTAVNVRKSSFPRYRSTFTSSFMATYRRIDSTSRHVWTRPLLLPGGNRVPSKVLCVWEQCMPTENSLIVEHETRGQNTEARTDSVNVSWATGVRSATSGHGRRNRDGASGRPLAGMHRRPTVSSSSWTSGRY